MKPKRIDRSYLVGWFHVRPKGISHRKARDLADEYLRELKQK